MNELPFRERKRERRERGLLLLLILHGLVLELVKGLLAETPWLINYVCEKELIKDYILVLFSRRDRVLLEKLKLTLFRITSLQAKNYIIV